MTQDKPTLILLTEYSDGNRTARVYKNNTNTYMALLYESTDDYNEAKYFDTEEDAEIFSEDWVLKHE